MTKLCTCCGKRKQGNEGSNLIAFDEKLNLRIHRSFFKTANMMGSTYKVSFIDVSKNQKDIIKVAVKWVRESHMCYIPSHFYYSVTACDKTSRVIAAFMNIVDTSGWKLRVVKPIILNCSEQFVSVEPFVRDVKSFQKQQFVRKGIYNNVIDVLDAVSHFSYVFSKGSYVISNLKAGVDEDGMTVTLVSPTLVSKVAGTYGCADLGSMKSFFSRHRCNSLCDGMERPNNTFFHDQDDKEDSLMVFHALKQ